jgi:hypothetical protein
MQTNYRISTLVALHTLLNAIQTGNQDDVLLLFASDPTATEAINQYNDDLHDVNFGELSPAKKIDDKYIEFVDKLAERSMKFKQERLKLPDKYLHPTELPSMDQLTILSKQLATLLSASDNAATT